jgi:hypothetical protein
MVELLLADQSRANLALKAIIKLFICTWRRVTSSTLLSMVRIVILKYESYCCAGCVPRVR